MMSHFGSYLSRRQKCGIDTSKPYSFLGGPNPVLSLICLFFMSGCTSDHCKELCENVSAVLNGCLIEWDAQWSILEKERAASFSDDCRNLWYAERSELEGWELEDAEQQCEESVLQLDNMGDAACESLRAIYLASPTY